MNVYFKEIRNDTVSLVFVGIVKKPIVTLLNTIFKKNAARYLQPFYTNIGKQITHTMFLCVEHPAVRLLSEHFGIPLEITSLLLTPSPPPTNTVITVVPHTFRGDLHPYQLQAFQFANSKPRTMLALDMGLGKTVIGVAYALVHLPALIVCPANVIDSWMTHIDAFAPTASCTKTYLDGSHDITVVSFHRLRHVTKHAKSRMCCIIADEAHYLKHETSARSILFAACQRTIPRTLLLTGTPAQRHMDMYHLLKLMDTPRFPCFYKEPYFGKKTAAVFQFAERYCVPKPVWLAGKKHGFKFGENRNVEELRLVCQKYLLRLTKEDVLELPTLHRNVSVVATLQGAAAREIENQLNDIETLRETRGSLYADAELLAMCRQTALTKVPFICPMLNDIHTSNKEEGRCIVFFHHKDVGAAYAEWMTRHNITFMFIDGSVSMQARTKILNEWTKEECTVQFGLFSLCATSTGLNLQFCTRILCTELTFHSCHHKQAEARIHRIGQTQEVYITYLLLKGSTDDMLWRCLNKKFETERALFDGDNQQKQCGHKRKCEYDINIVPL